MSENLIRQFRQVQAFVSKFLKEWLDEPPPPPTTVTTATVNKKKSSLIDLPQMGEKINLRALEEKDLEDLYAMEMDPEIRKYIHNPVSDPFEEWLDATRKLLGPTYTTMAIETADGSSFVGRAGLKTFDKQTTKEIIFVICREFQDKNLELEIASILIHAAFNEANANDVVALVHPQNSAMRSFFGSLGFVEDGRVSPKDDRVKFGLSFSRYSLNNR